MAKRLLVCILALSLLLGLFSCGEETPAPGQSGAASEPALPVGGPAVSPPPQQVPDPAVQPLTLAFHPGESLHPVQTASRINLTLAPLLYEGLFRLDAAFSPQPVLCRSYEVSGDGLTWTFELAEASFSDGTALTASLAAQALKLAQKSGGAYAGRFTDVNTIAANRSGQLVITLLRPNSRLPALLDIPIALGSGTRPLGTGPYAFAEGEEGVFSLELREDWWRGTAMPVEHIRLYPVSGSDDLIHGFDGGEITLVDTDPTGTGALGYSSACDRTEYATATMLYLGFNTANTKGALRTAKARQAVLAALDREDVAASAYAGYAAAAALPLPPQSGMYDPELAESLAPEGEAAELMTQAKLTGRKVTLLVNSENTFKAAAAQRLAAQLEAAGLTVELSRLAWKDYVAALEGGQFDLYLAEVALTADFDLTSLVGSAGALNYGGWSSADTDALLQAARSAGGEEGEQALRDLYAHLAQEVPMTPICFKNGVVLSQWGRITGLNPIRGDIFYQFENWSLK